MGCFRCDGFLFRRAHISSFSLLCPDPLSYRAELSESFPDKAMCSNHSRDIVSMLGPTLPMMMSYSCFFLEKKMFVIAPEN